MRNDLTEIVAVLDRSGSMVSIRSDAEGGFNSFVEEQKKAPGEARLTLVQFDTEYEFIHIGKPIKEVSNYTLTPRGGTALLDAVGRAIAETGKRLESIAESSRPGLVIVIIVTDGLENSSKEYSLTKIKEMIQHQQDVYKWKFIYLGANQDAFAAGAGMGIRACGTQTYAPELAMAAYMSGSRSVSRMRDAAVKGVAATDIDCAFTDEERLSMNTPKSQPTP